jgi:membrane fusion protein, multidrug efflux system
LACNDARYDASCRFAAFTIFYKIPIVKFDVSPGRLPSVLLLLATLIGASGCTQERAEGALQSPDSGERKTAKSNPSPGETPRGGGARGGGGRGASMAQAVEVAPLMRRDLSETLRVVGSLAPNETATIRPETMGLIRSIHFKEGQRVKKGDLLVKIDDSELRAQLAQTESRYELAKLNLTRAENLRQTLSNTQADADRARSEFAAAQADIDLLKVRLARTEITAPFDGSVEARTLSPGDYVNPQSIITTLNDLSRLKVGFQVPERYLSKVKPGTPFSVKSITVDAATAVKGEVYFVNNVIDRTTRSSDVKGFLDNESAALKAGMFAEIEIVLEVRKGALAVPEGAILVEQRGPQIVIVQEKNGEKIAEFVPVLLGLRERGLVEVRALKGELTDQTQVVAAGVGSIALFPGARLETRPLRADFRVED